MRQFYRRLNGFIRDFSSMKSLIPIPNSLQNGNGVLYAGFADIHRLKAPFQRRILFNMLFIFRQGCRTDHLNLAASQGWF